MRMEESDYAKLIADHDAVIEERTEARAELFRAQERVRELETQVDILVDQVRGGRKRQDALEERVRELEERNAHLEKIARELAGDETQWQERGGDERLQELEDLLAPWGLLVTQRVERLTLGGVDREHDREENRAMDRVRAEAVEIATKRREGK